MHGAGPDGLPAPGCECRDGGKGPARPSRRGGLRDLEECRFDGPVAAGERFVVVTLDRILAPECVRCDVSAASRKRTLQALGEIFAGADPALTAQGVFDLLVARERLGSTGLGDGCALPHARVPGLDRALAAFLRLGKGVDFDAPDHVPVDLVFGLLVPQKSTDEHLETLAAIARVFADDRIRASVRSEEDPARIREILAGDGTIESS